MVTKMSRSALLMLTVVAIMLSLPANAFPSPERIAKFNETYH